MLVTKVCTFPVNGAGRSNDHAFHIVRVFYEVLAKQCSAGKVHLFVSAHFVHGLPRSRLGGEVHNGVVTGQNLGPKICVAHIAAHQLHSPLQIGRKLVVLCMNLWTEAVQNSNFIRLIQEFPREVSSDETGATGNEYLQNTTTFQESFVDANRNCRS